MIKESERTDRVETFRAYVKGVETTHFKRTEDENGIVRWTKASQLGERPHWVGLGIGEWDRLEEMYQDYKEHYGEE